MSDSSSASTPAFSANPRPKKGSPLRLVVLLILLLLTMLGYIYDRKVAKLACENGYQAVMDLRQKLVSDKGNATASSEDVQKLLSKRPKQREEAENYVIETYGYRRGFPLLTYDIYVIYRKDEKANCTLWNATILERPAKEELPHGTITPVELTEEQRTAIEATNKPQTTPGDSAPKSAAAPAPVGPPGAVKPAVKKPADVDTAAKPNKPEPSPFESAPVQVPDDVKKKP